MTSNDFYSIEGVLKKIVRSIKTPDQGNYYIYAQILRDCLPEKWQSRVILGQIEFGRWELWVSTATEGQQLRFFAIEIEARLAKKLPHPPKLDIKPRPDVWSGKRHYAANNTSVRKIYPQRRQPLTDKEADNILNAFLDRGL